MHGTRSAQERLVRRQSYQHDGRTTSLTLARQTKIRMPMMDVETTFTALFVLGDDVPNNMINGFLEQVNKESQVHNIWLADSSIPDGLTDEDGEATVPPIDAKWQSAFFGNTVEQAFEFLATVSIQKSLNRTYIIVLDGALYEQKNWVVLHRIDEEGEITSVPCAAHMCMVYIDSYTWARWPDHLDAWRKHCRPIF